jgi:endonuclease/exonuclease/phosphatase (EEP) superfamily protein YafD
MFRHPVRSILVLVSIAVMVVCLWPQLIGLSRVYPFAYLVVSRGSTTVIAVIVLAVLAVLDLFVRRVKPLKRVVRNIAQWLLVFVIISGVIVWQRGWSDKPASPTAESITVFSWNTMGGKAGAETIAKNALDAHATIVSLPETTKETGSAIAEIMGRHNSPMTVLSAKFDDVYKGHSTVVLISTKLGPYKLDTEIGSTTESPSLVARPSQAGRPVIVAAHATAPDGNKLENWRRDLSWLAGRCQQANVIMAGDFNASIDNVSGLGPAPMGNCGDVALTLGAASIGTWPTSQPTLVGTQIDHVFYSAEWKPTGVRILTGIPTALSDHRPVIATLTPVTK